jgi:hypothetical protein
MVAVLRSAAKSEAASRGTAAVIYYVYDLQLYIDEAALRQTFA